MLISLIAAMDENGGIGYKNQLPWHLPAEYRIFKAKTIGHHIIMGRSTFESLGKPLPARTHIILSRNPFYPLPHGCILAPSLAVAFELAKERGETEAFIIGGAQVYAQGLPYTKRMYHSLIHATFVVDIYFPLYNKEDWFIVHQEHHPADDKNPYAFTFKMLKRIATE